MTTLAVIWLVSLVLAGASLLFMAVLIVRRVFIDRANVRRAARRAELQAHVIAAIDSECSSSFPPVTSRDDRRVLAEIGRELVDLVRGEDRARLLAVMEANGIVETALADMTARSARRREAAVARLAPFDRDDVRSALLNALRSDPVPAVRMSAAFALAEWGGPPPLPIIVEALGGLDHAGSLRLRALLALIAAASPLELVELTRSNPSPSVLAAALHALGQSGTLGAIDLILDATVHAEVTVRTEAFMALAQLGHPDAEPAILGGLADPAWQVREKAALCAGQIGLVSAIPALEGALSDPQWWVRFQVCEALTRLGAAPS
jgi:HEAT repeat protein